MDDRFLFRGISKEFNNWIIGHLEYAGQALISTIDDCRVIDPKTIGQCTGLKDEKGNLIFEGDVLLDGHIKHEVFFDEFYGFRKAPLNLSRKDYHIGLQTHEYCEIIGNIHEGEYNE